MAFLQTASGRLVHRLLERRHRQPIAKSTFGSDIATIRGARRRRHPVLRRLRADNTDTEIADSCTNVDAIAAKYERSVTTYDVTRIDLDIEDDSLNNTAGIDRRNKAIAKVAALGRRTGRSVEFAYTLPTTTTGLAPTASPCCRTRSTTAPGSTSSTS